MILIGVEEAGRGPVIGPMTMCAFAIDESQNETLLNMGVKDSKLLSPVKRAQLKPILEKNYEFEKIIVSAKEVDAALNDDDMNLNWLEAVTSAGLCNRLIKKISDKNITIILDCPSTNIPAYSEYFRRHLVIVNKNIKVLAEHKADVNHPVVGAASIVAKVTRDAEIEKIKQKIGINFGSGYPADPKTKLFLEENYDKYDIFRKSWESWKRIARKKNSNQLNLDSF